jgi:3-methylfumaryl-CoA hydratase
MDETELTRRAAELRAAIGSTWARTDVIRPICLQSFAAILNLGDPLGQDHPLPHLWHWTLFNPPIQRDAMGSDGREREPDFLPFAPFPQRIWVGGHLRFHRPLRIGASVRRESRLERAEIKRGRNGPIAFTTQKHLVLDERGVAIEEEQDVVFHNPLPPSHGHSEVPVMPVADWSHRWAADEILLFQYSALTNNNHRVHYDVAFARDEGHAGLIVHGPLLATMMFEAVPRDLRARISTLRFRRSATAFAHQTIELCGRVGPSEVELWALCPDGAVAMQGWCELVSAPGA